MPSAITIVHFISQCKLEFIVRFMKLTTKKCKPHLLRVEIYNSVCFKALNLSLIIIRGRNSNNLFPIHFNLLQKNCIQYYSPRADSVSDQC